MCVHLFQDWITVPWIAIRLTQSSTLCECYAVGIQTSVSQLTYSHTEPTLHNPSIKPKKLNKGSYRGGLLSSLTGSVQWTGPVIICSVQ